MLALDNNIINNNIKDEGINNLIINSLLNSAFVMKSDFVIPPIDVAKGIDVAKNKDLIQHIQSVLPHCLKNTNVLKKPIPDFEKYYLHFVRKIEVDLHEYIYVLKINLKYGGGGKPIIHEKHPDKYLPGYHTNKLYFQAHIIPVEEIKIKHNEIISFKPRKYTQAEKYIQSSGFEFMVSEIFDQQDFSDISQKFSEQFNQNDQPFKPLVDYYPLKFAYSTIALNLLYPDQDTIIKIMPVFDKITQILFDENSEDILTQTDKKILQSYYSLYHFERKVNENRDLFWDISISDIKLN